MRWYYITRMKVRCSTVGPIVLLLGFGLAATGVAGDPAVSNVRAVQRANTKLVDIYYDVADADGGPLLVKVTVSTNSGATFDLPATNFSGSGYGAGVATGADRRIVWDAGADWSGQLSSQMMVKVIAKDHVATISAPKVMVFNGIAEAGGWGDDFIFEAGNGMSDSRTLGACGGIPLVDFYTSTGGVAFFNTSTNREDFKVVWSMRTNILSVTVGGGTSIERYYHTGDYYIAVRHFAEIMKAKGIAARAAPSWAFDPVWETYGYEESFTPTIVTSRIPLLNELGIKTITFDSGWYGRGTTEEWDTWNGDYPVNPDVVGSESALTNLIGYLHAQGFKVRAWWQPGVAQMQTTNYAAHPGWFLSSLLYPVVTSDDSADSNDIYWDPVAAGIAQLNSNVVQRFIGYGFDGFKEDAIFDINTSDPARRLRYRLLFEDILDQAKVIETNFAINICNCGVAQDFYLFNGENQLITADPTSGRQARLRCKYLQALNVNGSAILGDHVELTKGDVGPADLDSPGFYTNVDFASIVPLGMVLETKFRSDPGALYRKWFSIYNSYKFYQMEWLNVPYHGGSLDSYLLRDTNVLYASFFTPTPTNRHSGNLSLSCLSPNATYDISDLVNSNLLDTITPAGAEYTWNAPDFTGSLVVKISPR